MDNKSVEEMDATPSEEDILLSSPVKEKKTKTKTEAPSTIIRPPVLSKKSISKQNPIPTTHHIDPNATATAANLNFAGTQALPPNPKSTATDANQNSAGTKALPTAIQNTNVDKSQLGIAQTDISNLATMIGDKLRKLPTHLSHDQLQSQLQASLANFFSGLNTQATTNQNTMTHSPSMQLRFANISNQPLQNTLHNQQRADNVAANGLKKKKSRGGTKVRARVQRAIERDNAIMSNAPAAANTGRQINAIPHHSIPSTSTGTFTQSQRKEINKTINEITSRSTPVTPQQRLRIIKQTGDLPLQGVNSPNANKRIRTKGETPPDVVHRNKKQDRTNKTNTYTTDKTMSSIVKDTQLDMAIVDMPIEGLVRQMNQEQYGTLYDAINQLLFSSMDTGNYMPTFEENRHTQGVMRIRCATQSSKTWLQMTILYITPLWNSMTLKVIHFEQLSRPKKILGFFKKCNASNESILKMIHAQNQCAWTDRWTIINRTTSPKGTSIAFGIEEEQLASLATNGQARHIFATYREE